MKIYFAPLEGLTGYVFRNAFDDVFGNADKYFTPFVSPSHNERLMKKEIRDVLPENNKPDMYLVPQILANNSEYFIKAARQMEELGYKEINLNAGCPSGTVVTKNKGAGFLQDTEAMKVFFDEIFSALDMTISVKTRIGMESAEEFPAIMDVYNQFPFNEVIIHPRTREQMYRDLPNMEAFDYAYNNSKHKLSYNGNINTVDDYKKIVSKYDVDSVMIGRGLITNPNLINEIKNGEKMSLNKFIEFHNILYTNFEKIMNGERSLLFKMKEMWNYWSELFEDSHKCAKKIRKAQNLYKYHLEIEDIFKNMEMK